MILHTEKAKANAAFIYQAGTVLYSITCALLCHKQINYSKYVKKQVSVRV